jgi:hypothetical protein
VRLDTRRFAEIAAGVTVLFLSVGCCCKQPPFLIGDTVSGGPGGSAFVKVAITLARSSTGQCRVVEMLPDRVYVFPGSALRWKVTNACDEAQGTTRRIKLTSPRPVPRERAAQKASTEVVVVDGVTLEPWSFVTCVPEIALGPQKDPRNVLFCEVPERVRPGRYKYGVEGDIEPYDPEIEVRKGGGS